MRDLLKEFENGIKVVKEWHNDDSGKPVERFVITQMDRDIKSYGTMERAMNRAIAIANMNPRPNQDIA